MSKKKARRYRGERASDLRNLSRILRKELPGFDPKSSLQAAASQCGSQELPILPDWNFRTSTYSWGYECDELLFPEYHPHNSSNLQPLNARSNGVRIQLSVVVVGQSNVRDAEDPFSVLEVEMQIRGQGENGKLFSAWHLDKHKGNNNDTPRTAHPEYHFQYGGKNLWKEVTNYGGMIIPEPPRLPHPPLDGILAVDFVLSNFFCEIWRELRDDSRYTKLVHRTQKLLWKPYISSLAKAWASGPYDETWPANRIWPQLNKRNGL
jgi:hypothetical protein